MVNKTTTTTIKGTITVNVDSDIIAEGRAKKIKWSYLINDYLRHYLKLKREEKVNPESEVERLKIILQQKEMELELQKKKNIKDIGDASREGRLIILDDD